MTAALLVAGGFAVLKVAVDALTATGRTVERTARTIESASAVERLVIETEAAARGFFVTRQNGYLGELRATTASLPAASRGLTWLVRGNSGLERQAATVDAETASSVSYWARALAAAPGSPDTKAIGDGERRLQALRTSLERLIGTEQRLRDRQQAAAAAARSRATLLAPLSLAGAVALFLLVGISVIYSVVRPVRRLARAADEISDGNYAVRVPERGTAEIAELGRTFNRMAASLAESRRQLERANRKLARLAHHDDLTGLPNRRRFREELGREVASAHRHGHPLALVLLDCDGLKTVNDTLGHTAGDDLLRHVAAVLDRRRRATDTPTRLGGDEFALVLPYCEDEEAEVLAEAIADEVRRTPFGAGEAEETFGSVSFGVAVLRADDDEHSLMRRADACLYEAKRGRSPAAA